MLIQLYMIFWMATNFAYLIYYSSVVAVIYQVNATNKQVSLGKHDLDPAQKYHFNNKIIPLWRYKVRRTYFIHNSDPLIRQWGWDTTPSLWARGVFITLGYLNEFSRGSEFADAVSISNLMANMSMNLVDVSMSLTQRRYLFSYTHYTTEWECCLYPRWWDIMNS